MIEIHWSKAPEGATHYAPLGRDYCWVKNAGNDWKVWDEREEPGSWVSATMSGSYMDSLIPRPTQWRGPEDGLPPVGTVCEARHHGGWAECEIIAHVRAPENCIEAIYQAADDWDWLSSPTNFRPLKSDKERAVEAALAQDCDPRDGMLSCHDFCARLYDAGFLRLPEEQS